MTPATSVTSNPPHLPATFTKKKTQILATLNQSASDYTDKSPKGSVDAEIVDLIQEINGFEGWVTTSSCAGRVSVFVEGRKGTGRGSKVTRNGNLGVDTGDGGITKQTDESEVQVDVAPDSTKKEPDQAAESTAEPSSGAGPGGKGYGNKWLYVSHSPVPSSHISSLSELELHNLFQLVPRLDRQIFPAAHKQTANLRLIKLAFSPLILHVLCADLRAAKPLLAAAINAGFRESGVQSLMVLDKEDAGVMVGVRSAGLGFETVVGYVDEEEGREVYRCCVDEAYLRMCVGVVNERFVWNMERRERLREELRRAVRRNGDGWEDETVRRERKKREGLARRETEMVRKRGDGIGLEERSGIGVEEEDVLDGGLFLDAT